MSDLEEQIYKSHFVFVWILEGTIYIVNIFTLFSGDMKMTSRYWWLRLIQFVPYLFVLFNHIRLLIFKTNNADKRIKFLPVNLMICVIWSFTLLFEIVLTTY